MSPLVYIALYGWLLVALVLFSQLGAVRGFVATAVGGFLLLTPVRLQTVDGVPPLDRAAAIAIGAVAATLLFAPAALQRYRFHWVDLVVAAALIAWGATNLVNPTGVTQALMDWWWFAMFAVVPYYLGRIHFASPSSLPLLARGIVFGSLLIAPLIAYEMVMSPTLHYHIYGVSTGNAMERFRMGGWRPRVFQPAGLGLAIWLGGSAIVAVALFWSGMRSRILNLPMGLAALASVALGFFSRGAGAIALMAMGIAVLFASWKFRWRKALLAVPVATSVYIGTAVLDSQIPIRPLLLDASGLVFGGDRAASLQTRFHNEAFLVDRALDKPLLGWGGWGDYRGEALGWQTGHGRVLTDGFWVIVLGQRGTLGLLGVYGIFLLPGVVAVLAAVRTDLASGPFLIVAGLALFTWVFALDLLFNGFSSPLQAVVAGALVSFAVAIRGKHSLRQSAAGMGRQVRQSSPGPPSRPISVAEPVGQAH